MIIFIAFVLLAYCLGSISSAIVVCKIMGLSDPRTRGSQNPGTTNVLRIGGKKAAALTLLGDVMKGVLPVLLAKSFAITGTLLGCVAFAAFIGHLFPIWFRFQGGKGVATSLGAICAMSWLLGLCVCLTWLIIALIFRYSSLAALISALVTPIYSFLFIDPRYLLPLSLMSIVLIVRHYDNIQRLVKGKESKITLKSRQN